MPPNDGAWWCASSYSGANGNCVEVTPLWRRSSRSANNGNCVEGAALEPAGAGLVDFGRAGH